MKELESVIGFAKRCGLRRVGATTLTVSGSCPISDLAETVELYLCPTSLHAYIVGHLSARGSAEADAVLAAGGAMP